MIIEEAKLDRLQEYLHFKIAMMGAVYFGYHKSPYFPKHLVKTTLWKEQILTIEEYWYLRENKGWKSSGTFHMIGY